MSETRKRTKRTSSTYLREKYSQPYVVPEPTIRDLALNLRVSQAHDAAMCLLIIEEAVRSIENRTESRELNLQLIEQLATEEKCRPIQHIIEAMVAAIRTGPEGLYASCLTITLFLEFTFGYQPDPSVAKGLYRIELSRIRHSTAVRN
jgi:hypothetical protein